MHSSQETKLLFPLCLFALSPEGPRQHEMVRALVWHASAQCTPEGRGLPSLRVQRMRTSAHRSALLFIALMNAPCHSALAGNKRLISARADLMYANRCAQCDIRALWCRDAIFERFQIFREDPSPFVSSSAARGMFPCQLPLLSFNGKTCGLIRPPLSGMCIGMCPSLRRAPRHTLLHTPSWLLAVCFYHRECEGTGTSRFASE